MGNPLHYRLELPQRCLQLIEGLWPSAEKTRQRDHPELGPLTSTFLISMSMPIINLPVERIERHKTAKDQGYADDSHIDPAASKAVVSVLGGGEFRSAPFYISDTWSFAAVTNPQLFNIADGIPDELATELGTKKAVEKADSMQTSQWCSIIRNALAHGGIAYLDKDGRTSYGRPVKMYAFVSGKYDDLDRKTLIVLNVLRISEANYRIFLRKWVEWLNHSGFNQLAA